MSKKIPIELWSVLALLVAVAFVGIAGGLYYAGWNLHEVFIDNPDRVLVWLMVIGEALGILLLWTSRPWRVR
jgi:hypothetical protein